MRKNEPVTNNEVLFSKNEKLVSSTDLKGIIRHCNDEFVRVSGYQRQELIGQPHNMIRHPDMPQVAFKVMWDHLQAGKPWMGLVKNRCKNGDYYWVDAYVTPVTENGSVIGYESVRSCPTREDVQRAEKVYAKYAAFNGKKQAEQPVIQDSTRRFDPIYGVLLSVALVGFIAGIWVSPFIAAIAALAPITAMAFLAMRQLSQYHTAVEEKLSHAFSHPIAQMTYTSKNGRMAKLSVALKSEKSHLDAVLTRIENASNDFVVKADTVGELARVNGKNLESQQLETDSVATAMNEMTAAIQDVSANVTRTAQSAEESRALAIDGEGIAENTMTSISQLGATVKSIGAAVTALSEQSNRIISAAKIIDQIAEQTNLLALNAAIEAARAGEQGRGFAVVADEVRSLAMRTQDSTKEIHTIINELSHKSNEAVSAAQTGDEEAQKGLEEVEKLEDALKEITRAMHDIATMTDQMATAVEEQSHVAEDVNKQVINIANLANSCLDTGKETSTNVDELTTIANDLKEVVVRFKRS